MVDYYQNAGRIVLVIGLFQTIFLFKSISWNKICEQSKKTYMKPAHVITILLFLASTFCSQAQQFDSIILGRWVTRESVIKNEIENSSESSYMQYYFDHNNNVSYGTSQYELGHRSTYSVQANVINMFNSDYEMQSVGHELTLIAKNPSNPLYRISLIRKDKFDEAWTNHDPTIKTSSYTFTGNFSLYDYIFSNSNTPDEYERNILIQHQTKIPPRYDELLKIKILINHTGDVTVAHIDGLPKLSSSNASKFKRRMENTSGYWINHETNQLQNGDTLELTFLTRSKSSLDFHSKAFNHFLKAAEYFGKENYTQGMHSINSALSLQDNNAQFYILRSLLYLKQNNLDKYCEDIVKANSINPLIGLSQTEVIDGGKIKIECSVKN